MRKPHFDTCAAFHPTSQTEARSAAESKAGLRGTLGVLQLDCLDESVPSQSLGVTFTFLLIHHLRSEAGRALCSVAG